MAKGKEITFTDALDLEQLILEEIKEEFQDKYISHNLINTIQVTYDLHRGRIVIDIPAKMYDINHYNKTGEIIYGPKMIDGIAYNSYDDLLETTGGFSGLHKNYLIVRVLNAIRLWEGKHEFELKKESKEVS